MALTSLFTDEIALRAALAAPQRLAAVRAADLLDRPNEAAFDRLAGLAAKLLDTPLATVTIVDGDRQFYTACVGMPEPIATVRATPLELSFCRFTVVAAETLAIADTRLDPRTRDMPSVREHGVHAYAGVPLFLHHEAIGTLCVMDRRPREWTATQLDVLGDLAESVMTEIGLRLAVRDGERQARALQALTRELAAAGAELQATNEQLRAADGAADHERRRLEAVLDALPVGVLIADADGRITQANSQVREVWGGAPLVAGGTHELPPRGWRASSGKPIRPDQWPLTRALRHGDRLVDEVIDIARFDGRLGTILNSAAPVRDADGQITGAVATVLDITSRVHSERALRQLAVAALAVARARTLDEVLQEVAEQARRIVGAHEAAATLTDGDQPSTTATSRSERTSGGGDEPGAPPATAHVPRADELVREANAPVRLTRAEVARHAAFERRAGGSAGDGQHRDAADTSWLAVPLVRSDGAHVGFIRLADKYDGDFTDSDEAILVQLAQMVTAAVEKSQADTLVHANAERTRRLLAVAAALSEAVTPAHVAGAVTTAVVAAVGAQAASVSVRSPSGQDVEVLSASGYPESLLDAWRRFPIDASVPVARAIRTGAPLWLGATHGGDDHPGLDALREATRLPSHAVLPLTAEGRAVGALVLSFAEPQAFALEDRAVLTAVARQCAQALERARLYDAERRARQAAEAANRAKFEFLATMSHELRTPLNAIGGYVDLIEMGLRGPVTGDQHHDLERVKRAQQHLLGLINDVLNFAKLDAGRVSYAITDVPVGDAVASVEAMITPQLRAKGLAYAAGTCAPATTVRADPEKLRQILLNLLTNALKFTDAGGRISVSCQADDTAVRLRVADTGMGIPADKVATIFDPFVQVDRGLSRPSEGIGLGLAISRDLARGMGGELTVDTRYGAGSTFTLTLPRG